MEIISKRLKKLREDAGLSQTKIGQLVGVPQSSIYRYEQEQSNPRSRHSAGMPISSLYRWNICSAGRMTLTVRITIASRIWKPLTPKWKNSWRCALLPIPE